jgi:His-Xaa-Ser system radical SAM maturase HxsC
VKPLILSGRALEVQSRAQLGPDEVFRLIDPAAQAPAVRADAGLVRSAADRESAVRALLPTVVTIGSVPIDEVAFETVIRLGPEFGYLAAGDIVAVDTLRGRVRTLYRKASRHNAFLVTERCNHYCLMCSQPPKVADDSWILKRLAKAIPLISPDTRSIGFTGGEPLLAWRPFIDLVALARDHLPDTAAHVLTNGRAFADSEVARAWADLKHPNLMAGIPIYAAVDSVHDYVVQARGAFDETVLGILRLREAGQRIEVRVVLHALTAPRIAETARWLARNLPFVDHVALMGLENTGFAIANEDELWIEPINYREQLALAVDILSVARVPVSVYNLPFCLLDRSVWPFARQSISDWKNGYLPACDDCAAKHACAGFFSSGRPRVSSAITPLALFAEVVAD